MVNAWNVAAASVNIAGNATLTASSAATNMPVTLLQQEDIGRHFRTGATTTVNIDLTFASNQSADTFAILGTNLTAAGIVRIKLSATALGNTDIYDSNSGNTAGTVDPLYEDAIVLASSVKSGWKYCRIVLTDTSLSYLEAGFLFISTRTQYSISYAYGAQRTWVDPSEQKKTKGGQTKIRARVKFRRWSFTMDFLTATERWALVEAMDISNGIATPILFVLDPSSTNLGRDSIFGLLTEVSPVAAVEAFGSDGLSMYSRPYAVDERL